MLVSFVDSEVEDNFVVSFKRFDWNMVDVCNTLRRVIESTGFKYPCVFFALDSVAIINDVLFFDLLCYSFSFINMPSQMIIRLQLA